MVIPVGSGFGQSLEMIEKVGTLLKYPEFWACFRSRS
jgi:hypothetical protein